MHAFNFLACLGLLVWEPILAAAAPRRTHIRSATQKHDDWNYPKIGDGINVNDPNRGGKLPPRPGSGTSGAFNSAYELLGTVTSTASDDTNNIIFNKYFNANDKQLVMNLFHRILGDGVHGAPAMTNIIVTTGDNDEDNPAPAELTNYNDPQPSILLSEDAWVYPNRYGISDACGTWADEGMTQDMYLLGSILLHEYMHWDWFLGSLHNGEIIDQENGYGWENARDLDKTLAKYNADSYGWYATELFWAVSCGAPNGYEGMD